jgi:hypothetical protein
MGEMGIGGPSHKCGVADPRLSVGFAAKVRVGNVGLQIHPVVSRSALLAFSWPSVRCAGDPRDETADHLQDDQREEKAIADTPSPSFHRCHEAMSSGSGARSRLIAILP